MYAAWKQDPANNAYPSYEAMDKRYTKEKPEEGNLLPRCSAQRKVRDTWKAVENHIKHPDKYACPDYTKKRDVHEYTLYVNNQAAEVGTDHDRALCSLSKARTYSARRGVPLQRCTHNVVHLFVGLCGHVCVHTSAS